MHGEMLSVIENFGCHQQCKQHTNARNDDFCAGWWSGVDTAASTAVCASLEVVTYLCDAIGDVCKGFTGYDTVTNRYHLLSGTTTGSSAAHHTYLKSGTA